MGGVLRTGARFEIIRQTNRPVDGEPVVYAVRIEQPDVAHATTLSFSSDAEPTLAEWEGGAPPDWASKWLDTLIRQLTRSATRSGQWPRKTRQWKDAP